MPSQGMEILGMSLAALGWISSIVSCALPSWKVSANIGSNILTAESYWEGLWMSCIFRSTGMMQCDIYDSVLELNVELQVARALAIISIIMTSLGLLMATVGAKCTNCMDCMAAKAWVTVAAGVVFILASLIELIPVMWVTHSIIMNFNDLKIPMGTKQDFGDALYLGWAAAAFLLIGGGLLCSSCPRNPEKRYRSSPKMVYSPNPSIAPGSSDKKDYV